MKSHARIINASIHVQLQQTEDEDGVSSWSIPPRTMCKSQLGVRRANATRGRESPIPVSEILPSICNSNTSGTKKVPPRSTPPRTVWNPQLHRLSWSQRHPAWTRSHPRIRNHSIHLQLQHAEDENGRPRAIPPWTMWKTQIHRLTANSAGVRGPAAPREDGR